MYLPHPKCKARCNGWLGGYHRRHALPPRLLVIEVMASDNATIANGLACLLRDYVATVWRIVQAVESAVDSR